MLKKEKKAKQGREEREWEDAKLILRSLASRASMQTRTGGLSTRVKKTVGNRSDLTGYRSNRSGPVTVSAGTQPAQIQNSDLNSKKCKNPKNTSKLRRI